MVQEAQDQDPVRFRAYHHIPHLQVRAHRILVQTTHQSLTGDLQLSTTILKDPAEDLIITQALRVTGCHSVKKDEFKAT